MKQILRIQYDDAGYKYSNPKSILKALDSNLELFIFYREGGQEYMATLTDLMGETVLVGGKGVKLDTPKWTKKCKKMSFREYRRWKL